ncbi:MAG: alternative ribosome rescue aminoacyl-tRNA hydrolase ArfB [Ignavibacteria bacterium]|nr:alternative ribosome rescue aminoacyl-tRNA hydrolase ArfB [Ignavibacteria bacterium]
MKFNKDIIENEMVIKTARSSGKGGQYVNKVSTKVILIFNIRESRAFDTKQKEILLNNLNNKLTKDGSLIVSSESERSQYLNKKKSIEKLYNILENALKEKTPRIQTNVPEEAKEKRIKEKKIISEKKKLRRKDFLE